MMDSANSARKAKVLHIYNFLHDGVNFASPMRQELVAGYRKNWNLDPATRVIGNVASLSHRKGLDLLIEAFGIDRKRFSRCLSLHHR